MKTLDELQQVHASYAAHAKQANYLYRSYIGGESYRAGQYLTHYIGEDSSPGDSYGKRLEATPLDNHVATTVDIYRSFLFREAPTRELGLLVQNPLVQEWMTDTDQEGQGMDSFLKTANDLAMVMGNIWILVDKASYKVETQAEEIALGIRAYAAMYTAPNVLDWHYERDIAGKMQLKYVKVKESENTKSVTYTCWHEDTVEKYTVSKNDFGELGEIYNYEEYVNPLGKVPFINHAPVRSPVKGLGYSMMADVADAQRYLYNLASEAEQAIRISSHPTLVKTPSADANAGAGAIITIDESMDPQLKPYLLTPSGATINSILDTMARTIENIQRATHTSAVQGVKTAQSGVALQTERQLLNAKLSDMADTLKETENAMWDLWFQWQGIETPEEFHVTYNDSFDIRDKYSELDLIIKAKAAGFQNSKYIEALDRELVALMVDDPEMVNLIMAELDPVETEFEPHIMIEPDTGEQVTANTEAEHTRLANQGYIHLGE